MTKLIKIAFTISLLVILYNKYLVPEEVEMIKLYRNKMCYDIKYRCYKYFIYNNEILYDVSNYPILYKRMKRICNKYEKDITNEKIRIDKIKLSNLLKTIMVYVINITYIAIICYL